MFNWLREWYAVRAEYNACKSCETLKQQLDTANYEKKMLLERVLNKDTEPQHVTPEPVPIRNANIPWNVRKHMLEAEDREKAKLLKEAAKPVSTEDLEKELQIATSEREAKQS